VPNAFGVRARRFETAKLFLPLLGAFLLACGGGEPAEEMEEGAEAPASGEMTFAPALGVDLASMTRSQTGLYSQVLEQGQGEPATNGTRLLVEYAGSFPDGRQFDASRPGEPFEVILGQTGLIPGFVEGLQGIRPGESRLLVIPPELGYGDRGAGDAVPPGATLVFRIKRVDGMAPAGDSAAPPPPPL
jgi:FKBP-type peptidyl-prolyl cis-trans isomerase FkpA